MSESALLVHLTEADSLDTLAREGFLVAEAREVIPTDLIRRVLAWALETFFADGRTVAPSRDAIVATWSDKFEELSIEMPSTEVEVDSIGWVIADLRSSYVRVTAEKFVTDFASEIAKADGPQRVAIFHRYADQMFATSQALVSRRNEVDGYFGGVDALGRLLERKEQGQSFGGMTFGIPLLDGMTFGVHPGEICVVCGEAASGKSWFAGYVLLNEWRQGRKAVLVTLENNPEMTMDRLMCLACAVPYDDFQRGLVSQQQVEMMLVFIDKMEASEKRPLIVQIEPEQRTASGIVRKALLEGADSLVIDQLSFVRHESSSRTQGRNFQLVDIMHSLKELIDSGPRKIPLLLLVQINRAGAMAARKEGRYRKEHLAESSAVEQTADFLWGIYQSNDLKVAGLVEFQCLKSRRTPERHFELLWEPASGIIQGLREIDINNREVAEE